MFVPPIEFWLAAAIACVSFASGYLWHRSRWPATQLYWLPPDHTPEDEQAAMWEGFKAWLDEWLAREMKGGKSDE